MNILEARQVVKLFDDEWDLGKKASKAKGKTCAWIYLFEVLEESEQIVLEKDNNKVIGICGYYNKNSKKYKFRKKFYSMLKTILINSSMIKNKKALLDYNDNYDYLPKELYSKFDGELSILIVDKKYRGKGYGKRLVLKTFELAKKDNMKNLYILSDESCNFEFYESVGCKKFYEKKIYNNENNDSEIGFIFEKDLM